MKIVYFQQFNFFQYVAPNNTFNTVNENGSVSFVWKIQIEQECSTSLQTLKVMCRTKQVDSCSNAVSFNIDCLHIPNTCNCDAAGNFSTGPVTAGVNYTCFVVADYGSFANKIITNNVTITKG